MARKIVVVSGKGGVGKTTVAVSLALQLAKSGARTLICDADFGLNNVDVAVGVEALSHYDIIDAIEGRCRAKQALIRHPKCPNLYILTSRRATPERYISPQSVKLVLDGLAPQFDFILIDSPAGVDEGFHRAVATADEGILVTTLQVSAARDADRVVTLLKSYRLEKIQLVVNMARGDLIISGECLSAQELAEILKLPLLGVIPDEYRLAVGDISTPHLSVKMMAKGLLTGKIKIFDVTKKYSGLAGNLRRVLKKRM
jgi:septum site-determining protein MinD